jgi:hypothetical protein
MKTNNVGTGKQIIDMTGVRVGRLVVIKRHDSEKNRARWLCQCDCGRTCIATGKTLRESKKKSCGCWFGERFLPASTNELPAMRFLMKRYIEEAKRRNLSFKLSEEEFHKLTSKTCSYCGISPAMLIDNYAVPYVYNGIDRIDNNIGYEISNCTPCCKFCNCAKSKLTNKEFIKNCERVTEFQNSKKLAEMTSFNGVSH